MIEVGLFVTGGVARALRGTGFEGQLEALPAASDVELAGAAGRMAVMKLVHLPGDLFFHFERFSSRFSSGLRMAESTQGLEWRSPNCFTVRFSVAYGGS